MASRTVHSTAHGSLGSQPPQSPSPAHHARASARDSPAESRVALMPVGWGGDMGERKDTLVLERADELWRPGTRREFLRLLGIGGTVVMLPSVFAACDDDDDPTGTGGTNQPVSLNLSNDFGILNYAYALEQLEAAFYTAVLASAVFNGLSAEEKEVLTDLRDHEVIHREY